VIDARNTAWANLMLHEFVRAHGTATSAWYDTLEANPAELEKVAAMVARAGGLGVSVWVDGRWQLQGAMREAGSEVTRREVAMLDLSEVIGDRVRVRLESTPSFWLVDRAGIDYSPDEGLLVTEVRPEPGAARDGRSPGALLAAADGREYRMVTGAVADLSFAVPPDRPGRARTYLLRATGWYRLRLPETAEPDVALLRRLVEVPDEASRVSVGRFNDALQALARGR
jgi:hypothetical protein